MKKLSLNLFLFSIFILPILAAGGSPETGDLESYICNAFNFLTGGVGKSLAAFACIGMSLGFVSGKLQWQTVLVFAIGMACIFGSPQIVKAFAGGNLACKDAATIE